MNIVSLKPRVFKRDKNSCGVALPYALMPLNSITPRSGEETREEKSHLIPFRAHFVKLHGIYESTRGASIILFPSALASDYGNSVFKTVQSKRDNYWTLTCETFRFRFGSRVNDESLQIIREIVTRRC